MGSTLLAGTRTTGAGLSGRVLGVAGAGAEGSLCSVLTALASLVAADVAFFALATVLFCGLDEEDFFK